MKERKHYIEGIKGLAALMVFGSHFKLTFLNSSSLFSNNIFLSFITDGSFAVYIFLLLSGYCVSLSLDRVESVLPLRGYALKRYLRIALPIAPIILVEGMLYLTGCFGYHDVLVHLQSNDIAMQAYTDLSFNGWVQAMFLSPIGKCSGWLDPTWMMKYIFFGSFVVLVLKLSINRTSKICTLLILSLSIIILALSSLYFVAVVLGCCIFEGKKALYIRDTKWCKGLSFAFMLVALLTYWLHLHKIISATSLVLGVELSCVSQNLLSWGVFRKIGAISFPLYLIHWPLICTFSLWFYKSFCGIFYESAVLVVFFVTLLVLLLLSYLYSRYVESKLNHFVVPMICNKCINNDISSFASS